MQESAGIIIINKNNNVLILSPNGKPAGKFWTIPKGKIEKEEETIDAAIREVLEETKINVDKDKLVYIGDKTYKTNRKKIHVYYIKCDNFDDDFNPILDWENDKHLWVAPEHAFKIVHEAQKDFFVKIQEILN